MVRVMTKNGSVIELPCTGIYPENGFVVVKQQHNIVGIFYEPDSVVVLEDKKT